MHARLQIAIFTALAAFGITLADGDAASTPTKPTKPAATTPTAAQAKQATPAHIAHKAAHASIIAELHQAKHLLDIALHDYHGHRAKADHEVARAIHLLEHGHHHKGEHKSNFKATPHHGPITPEMQKCVRFETAASREAGARRSPCN